MIEKGGMVVWEINVGRDPTSLVPAYAGIVPVHKNHIDARAIPILENHVNARTVHIPENHIDTGTIPILESRVDARTVHIHADMPTGVRIP